MKSKITKIKILKTGGPIMSLKIQEIEDLKRMEGLGVHIYKREWVETEFKLNYKYIDQINTNTSLVKNLDYFDQAPKKKIKRFKSDVRWFVEYPDQNAKHVEGPLTKSEMLKFIHTLH